MKKQFFIPEKWIELSFGVGASVVIIGALMKITHNDLGPISGNDLLSAGLITEAVIFLVAGLRGYYTAQNDSQPETTSALQKTADVDAEAKALKQAFVDAKEQISALSSNLRSAATATQSLSFPTDLQANMESLNINLQAANNSVAQIDAAYSKVYTSLQKHPDANDALLQANTHLRDQLDLMSQRIAELNVKYAALVDAMRK